VVDRELRTAIVRPTGEDHRGEILEVVMLAGVGRGIRSLDSILVVGMSGWEGIQGCKS
jgi:hypothetical protein